MARLITLSQGMSSCARHTIVAIVLLSTTSFIRPASGQSSAIPPRAAPSLGPAFLPGSNEMVPNSIVTWGYWGIQAKTCSGDAKSIRCTVIVGNGDTVARSICLSGAQLNFSPTDSVAVFLNVQDAATGLLAAKRAPSLTAPECVTVAPHGAQNVVAILSPPPQKKGLSISIYLEERQQSGVASSLTARARIPLLAETK